jgi:heat shock protein HslJ
MTPEMQTSNGGQKTHGLKLLLLLGIDFAFLENTVQRYKLSYRFNNASMIRGLIAPFLFLVFILTMVLSFSSCCRKKASVQTQNKELSESQIQQNSSPQDIQTNRWDNIYAIEVIHGKALDKEEYTEGLPRLELQIQQGRLVGFTGCNSFQAQAKLTQNEDEVIHIEIGPIMSTKKGCIGTIDEQHFFQALESSSSLLLSNNRILLINEEGVIVLQGLIVD